jgi:ankyrin repeat protein
MKCGAGILILGLLAARLSFAAADSSLVDAAQRGDRDAVVRMLRDGASADTASADGATALHWATHHDDTDLALRILSSGAGAGVANDYGVTPLHLACTNRNSKLVAELLAAGADPNAAKWGGETVLMSCARTGSAGAVAALLEAGADPNAGEERKSQTALMWAAAESHADAVQLLLDAGADIAATAAGGFTPLLFAARGGDPATARALLAAGADPEESTPADGNTLVVAAAGGHEELALLLLEAGANPNSAGENGITALHHAVANGMAALNGVRYDPVYRLIPGNMHSLAAALLEAGADPNAQIADSLRLGPDGSPFDMEGATPFLLASVSADVELMQLLESKGADQAITGKGGTTALMAAARAACTGACAFKGGNKANDEDVAKAFEAVRTVVEMGIDVNAKNDEGQTAMHMAAFTGADAVVKYLADSGADVNVVDHYGETPWSMASGISPVLRYRGLYGNHQSTAALLESLGATTTSRDAMDPNAPPPPGQ